MTISDILHLRLQNQLISDQRFKTPAEVVSCLGAVQAQDYFGAKWSLGLRVNGCKDSDIDKAISDKSIIRTWPMRGTLHFVAAEDARWMLKLLTPRIISGAAGRYRQLELNEKIFKKSQDLLEAAMEGGKQFTRGEVYKLLEDNGIATSDQRGIHIVGYLAQNQILCHGTHQENQPTYALLDEWVPKSKDLEGEQALFELITRYFKSHGPATLQDFVWWTGLKISDAKLSLKLAEKELKSAEVNGQTYWYHHEMPDLQAPEGIFLLPGFDEYMLGYTDRTLMVDQLHSHKIVPGKNGVFISTIIIKGKVEGGWKRTLVKDAVQMEMTAFEKISLAKKKVIEKQVKKYSRFLGKKTVQMNWE